MGNMGYCRFRNTLPDLRDCREYIDDDLEDEEKVARTRLLRLCADILEDLGIQVDLVELAEVTARLAR